MLAVVTLLVILGPIGVDYGIYALVRDGRNQEGARGPSPSARSTRWRTLGC
jgi:hypothetical protein